MDAVLAAMLDNASTGIGVPTSIAQWGDRIGVPTSIAQWGDRHEDSSQRLDSSQGLSVSGGR